MGIIAWICFGLVVGVIAKLLMPGRDPGGFIVTMALGVAGALVGGFIGRAMGFYGPNQGAGWLMSILGAVILLFIYRMIVHPQRVTASTGRAPAGACPSLSTLQSSHPPFALRLPPDQGERNGSFDSFECLSTPLSSSHPPSLTRKRLRKSSRRTSKRRAASRNSKR